MLVIYLYLYYIKFIIEKFGSFFYNLTYICTITVLRLEQLNLARDGKCAEHQVIVAPLNVYKWFGHRIFPSQDMQF